MQGSAYAANYLPFSSCLSSMISSYIFNSDGKTPCAWNLMIHIALSICIILEVDLDLVVHLLADVLATEACYERKSA
jgi:hypothetical protein